MGQDNAFGQLVRQRRRTLDLTQDELARRVGCAAVTLRKIEAGDLRPSQQIAERLALALAIPLEERAGFVRQARSAWPGGRPPEPTPTPQVTPDEIGAQDLSGRAIRGYLLGEKLGAGSFGAVYRGVQPLVERDVAIKIILPQFANHPDFIRRFEAEAQLVARLEHPHIVPLYDYWREPGVAYLVMRLLRGGSIHDLINRGPLPLDQVNRLLEQMCAALLIAHRAGVIHRDLKPSNVLLDEDLNAYLADFGIAKNLGSPEDATQSGLIIGSPAYLSPEQINSDPVRPQTDVYALGVMLYEMLTGARPFSGPTPIVLIQQHLFAPMPPLSAQREGLPAALDEVIAKATAKDANDRYSEVDLVLHDFQTALNIGHIAIQTLPLAPQPPIDLVNPYKGLRPFEEADVADFFGRESLTQQLLARLGEGGDLSRFLAIVGPSGSGKSSVVSAGLIPALRRGGLPGSENWFIVETLPGPHPLEEIEAALLRVAVNPPESLLPQITEDRRGLLRAIHRSLPQDGDTELVLVLDQFEEVFTLIEDESERALLLDALVEAVLTERSRVRVIVTLRADFIDKPLRYVDFAELMQRRMELVLPLTPDEIERAIAGPASRVGLQLEAGLVEAITADVIEQPGGLPLLQYALTELYEHRQDHALTKSAYQAIGGVKGALGRRAEEVYASLDEPAQTLAKQIFLRLVTLGEGVEDTRRRVARAELEALDEGGIQNLKSKVRNVLDVFGKARLLSFDRDLQTRGPTVEVAHEALLREWSRLREWLIDSRAEVRLQRALRAGTSEWLQADRETSFLLRGSRLQQFEEWATTTSIALTNDERAYLQTSLDERERQRQAEEVRQAHEAKLEQRAKRVLQGLVAVAVIAAIISGALALLAANRAQEAQIQQQVALTQKQEADTQRQAAVTQKQVADNQRLEAEKQRQEALRQASIGLAAQAVTELDGTAPERSVLLALEALENYPYTGQAESALAKAVENGPTYIDYDSQMTTGSLYWNKGAWSPNGRWLAGASGGEKGNAVVIWDAATGERVALLQSAAPTNTVGCEAFDLAWAPDNERIIALYRSYAPDTCTEIQPPTLWDMDRSAIIRSFDVYTNATSADWSSDGQAIAIGDEQGMAKIWNASDGTLRWTLPGHTGRVNDVVFSPTGNRVATASEDGTAIIWDVASGQIITSLVNNASVTGVSWSPDEQRLGTSSKDGLGRVWDATTGAVLYTLPGHAGPVNDIVWTRDDKRIATVSDDGTFRIWNAETGTEVTQVRAARVSTIALSPDGEQVATGAGGGSYESTYFRIWRILSDSTQMLSKDPSYAQIRWSPDGRFIGASSVGASIWDAHTWQELYHLDMGEEFAYGYFDWSPDSRYMILSNGQNVRIWESGTGIFTDTKVTQKPNFTWATGWSADGSYVAAATYPDYKAVIQDVRTGKVITTVGDGTCFMHAPHWSPRSNQFVTGCMFTPDPADDTPTTIWDARGNKIRELPSNNGESVRADWSPDGARIAVGYEDGTVKIWDAATGIEETKLSASNGIRVYQVTWSPDGKRIASVDSSGLVKVWDLASGEAVMNFQTPGLATSVDWSPDGKYLGITANQAIATRVWQSTAELIQYARECCVFRELTVAERQQFGLAAK